MSDAREHIRIDELCLPVRRKAIKHIHIAVYPPDGRVLISAPLEKRPEVIHAFVLSRLGWIRDKQEAFRRQPRESAREFLTRETHYLWGRRYLLRVEEQAARPGIELRHDEIVLTVRPGSDRQCRERIMHEWHKRLLRAALPPLIRQWEAILDVTVNAFFVQRMKTRWGSCTPDRGYVRFNTELVKKPKDLLEYVVAHELCHLREPRHDERYYALLGRHYPRWRQARADLNALPVA